MAFENFIPSTNFEFDADSMLVPYPADTPVDEIGLMLARNWYILGRQHQEKLNQAPNDERSVATDPPSESQPPATKE